MCGIAGLFQFRSGATASEAVLEKMAQRMAHRGPDGEGYHHDGPLGFAHRRLAIIDLEGGVQPMASADERLWICYNGEVFNFVELFEELRSLGHRPRTRSDTEAVLLAYAQWGLDLPQHLNGMFAVAIWDRAEKRLVLCRDRMGVKPLYWAETPDGMAFASEMKALRVVPGVDTALDPLALDDYMTMGLVVHPKTLLKGVRKLEPGTLMVVDAEHGIATRRYWQLRFVPDGDRSAADWHEEIRSTFDDAVRIRLRSDVPVGVLASGGVDSTAILTTVARHRSGNGASGGLHTYCVGVDLPGAKNEFEWARQLTGPLGTIHHELKLSPAENGALLLEAAALLDEPLVEPMVAQLLAVCRLARKNVTVLLSGEGSDETWFGYTAYRLMYGIELGQRLVPTPLLRGAGHVMDRLARYRKVPASAAKFLRLASEPLERRYLGLNFFDTQVKDQLYSASMRQATSGRDARESVRRLYDDAGGPEPLSRMAAVDCRAWLVDNTLMRSDLMSMAASLELRVPFLDYRLVELAARVPARLKVTPRSQKVILKRALADRIPAAIANRRKAGFPTPMAGLLRSEWGLEVSEAILGSSARTAGLFDRAALRRFMAEHRSGNKDWNRILFQVLMLEYWARAAADVSVLPASA